MTKESSDLQVMLQINEILQKSFSGLCDGKKIEINNSHRSNLLLSPSEVI